MKRSIFALALLLVLGSFGYFGTSEPVKMMQSDDMYCVKCRSLVVDLIADTCGELGLVGSFARGPPSIDHRVLRRWPQASAEAAAQPAERCAALGKLELPHPR